MNVVTFWNQPASRGASTFHAAQKSRYTTPMSICCAKEPARPNTMQAYTPTTQQSTAAMPGRYRMAKFQEKMRARGRGRYSSA